MTTLHRRDFVTMLSGFGVTGAFSATLWGRVQQDGPTITKDMLVHAEAVAGLQFTDEERELMIEGVNENLESLQALRTADVPNAVPPALQFEPTLPGREIQMDEMPLRYTRPRPATRPSNVEELAFAPVTHLAELIRTRLVSSVELTNMYLGRLKRHGPTLECVITLTEEHALQQARRADDEIARGTYRGPLHGIPWGAKDLLAEDAYRTTWGAKPFETQTILEDATVVTRLEQAGAVLVAKLSLGALAWGDVWFGGKTKNPWNLEQGSSGSSAGSAAATVAGLVGFAIGSETLGSIVSPSTRCGATGHRPTFGRVSRAGAMALSWSMDKLGPICRTAEDCALVLHAINGADGKDPTARDVPFNWDANRPLSSIRVGYLESAFDTNPSDDQAKLNDLNALAVVGDLVRDMQPVALPGAEDFPLSSLRVILNVEAASAFDELTRSGRDDQLVRQIRNAWPNVFRQSRLIPAVEYLQANRVRTMLMGAMDSELRDVDVFIAPSFAQNLLLITNLTGHPATVVCNGFRDDGTPTSISFIGNLFRDAEALRLAKAFQDVTDHHLQPPPEFS